MDLLVVAKLALGALARNKMRSTLTMLGIIIGVAAVICVVAIGKGGENQVQEQLRNLGDNLVWIEAGSRNRQGVRTGSYGTKSLTLGDALAIGEQIPTIKRVSPHVDGHAQLIYAGQNWNTQYRGVSPDYLEIRAWPVVQGSSFSVPEVERAADVCVLGSTVAQNLFGNSDPIGKTIRLQNLPCRVIGVLESKGLSAFGFDQDDVVLLPYTTVQQKVAGINWLKDIMCSATSEDLVDTAGVEISKLLRQRHHLQPSQPDDFNVRSPEDIILARGQANHTFALLLASIASVSLVVGGIGIMNIMLVSVTERTREIGVRMAVGATESDVKMQFLTEAVMMSLVGGMVGIVVGVSASGLIARMFHWPALLPASSIALAVIFSASVGIFFGYYPAQKAASLDPIDALRFE
jgi:putative ABC transport system permease protein